MPAPHPRGSHAEAEIACPILDSTRTLLCTPPPLSRQHRESSFPVMQTSSLRLTLVPAPFSRLQTSRAAHLQTRSSFPMPLLCPAASRAHQISRGSDATLR